MPGIAVIINKTEPAESEAALFNMLTAMERETFYRSSSYSNASIGLHIGWVCHTGSDFDCLPLKSADGRRLVFFYGEHHRQADSNGTSVAGAVLDLFERHGLDALPLLNGWFQGVLVDLERHEVAVFVDRYGMQRLHCHITGDSAIFASEAKALLAARPELRSFDLRGLGEFLSCGCVLENRSLFTGISTLPAASVRVFRHGALERNYTYFSPGEWESQDAVPEAEYRERLIENFPRALRRCMVSNRPLAISLTGGFDTRMIMAWVPPSQLKEIPCYTFGGMYRECFDVKIARKVAHLSGCSYQVLELGSDFLKAYPTLAEKTIRLSDGCLGATNAYELYLNQRAREIAAVRITGSYGSEVMRGARAFKAVPLPPGLLSPDFQPHADAAVQTFAATSTGHPVSFSVFKQAPWYYYNRLVVEQSQVAVRTPYMDNDFVGLVYRRPSDSTESRKLARYLIGKGTPSLASLPTDTGNCSYPRHVWSQFLFKADYCYKSGMPQWLEKLHHMSGPLSPERVLIGRHRFAHFRVWYRNQLAPYVREILLDRRARDRPYFNHRFVESMLTKHIKGEGNYTDEIERVLTVELTCRQFIDRQ